VREILPQIRTLLMERAAVDKESVQVFFNTFGQIALEIDVICFIKLPDYKQFCEERENINLAIMEIIENKGVSIAQPHLVIDELPTYPPEPLPPRPSDAPPQES
jgi:small-conductance mechanosensitive channel